MFENVVKCGEFGYTKTKVIYYYYLIYINFFEILDFPEQLCLCIYLEMHICTGVCVCVCACIIHC